MARNKNSNVEEIIYNPRRNVAKIEEFGIAKSPYNTFSAVSNPVK